MSFYDIPKDERATLVKEIKAALLQDLMQSKSGRALQYFEDADTYIRKSAYLNIGRLYVENPALQKQVIALLHSLATHPDFKVRQTVINAAGEIGKTDFYTVQSFFDTGLLDAHHAPRNAVIGSIKKMGEVNPVPVLQWAQTYLHHPDKEIRREICHGEIPHEGRLCYFRETISHM